MPKVLIIEDRRENIVFIANSILKPLGYDVITAMDGQTGLQKAQEESPDLIITDLKLPRMGGLEVLEALGKKGVHIPTIVMTFHGTEDTAMRALRLGARDYLIKPFTIEEMQAALNRASRPTGGVESSQRVNRLEQKLSHTKKELADREDQLQRLSAAVQMAARVPRLEQELTRAKAILSAQGHLKTKILQDNTDARVAKLEQTLAEARTILATRENQLRQMQQYVTKVVKNADTGKLAQHLEACKEANGRLYKIAKSTQTRLENSQNRAASLEAVIVTQKKELTKYQQQTRTLAEELRNLSEAVRLLSQDLQQQTARLSGVSPQKD